MRYLGIDFGTKKVGVAYSDEHGSVAFPYGVFPNDDRLLASIKRVIEEKKPQELVLGESVDLKGKPNAITETLRFFQDVLQKSFDIPIHTEQEFFTTKEAERIQGSTAMTDASAAALILQSYLDKQHGKR